MSLPYPRAKIIDGDHSVATPLNTPEFESPIPRVAAEYLLREKYRMSRNDYEAAGPLPLNTPHPDYPTFYLVSESPRRDIGLGSIIDFERTYAAVPATHYDWNTIDFSAIGLTIALGGGAYQTRTRRQWNVDLLLQFDYCLCTGSAATFVDPIFGSYSVSKPGDIKRVLDMQYCFQGTISGATYGGLSLATDILNVQGTVLPTWPTADQYLGMIEDALTNGWTNYDNIGLRPRALVVPFTSNTLAPPGGPFTSGHAAGVIDTAHSIPAGATYSGTPAGGIMPVKPSALEPWQGNIFRRTSFWVLAQ